MVDLPGWIRHVYGLHWPEHLMDKDQWRQWHVDASQGRPPDIVDVVTQQYNRLAPWYVREALWEPCVGLGSWTGKKRLAREMSRGVGKTLGQSLLFLYLAEYEVPYIERTASGMEVAPENRRLNIISRSAQHIGDENMMTMHQMLSHHAPWLKLPDQEELWDDPDAVIERQIRKRKFRDSRMDFVNGVSVRGYGWDQSTRGTHPIISSVDDLVAEDNWHQAEEQYRVLQGGIVPSVIGGGIVMATGTPQAPGDMYDIVADSGSWDYAQYPGYDEDNTLGYRERNERDIDEGYIPEAAIRREEDWYCLSPAFLPYEELQHSRGESRRDEVAWLREFMLKRVVTTLTIVDPNDWHDALDPGVCYVGSVPSNHPYPVYCGVDPSLLKESDVAFVVVEVREDEERRVLCVDRIKSSEETNPLEIVRKMNELHNRYHPKFLVEGNGYQAFIAPFMRALVPGIKVDDFTVTNVKHTSAGWPLIGTFFESGSVTLPWGPTPRELELLRDRVIEADEVASRSVTRELEHQVLALMYSNGKVVEDSKIKTDLASALYLALKASEEASRGATSVEGFNIRDVLDGVDRDYSPELVVEPYSVSQSSNPSDRLGRASKLDRR